MNSESAPTPTFVNHKSMIGGLLERFRRIAKVYLTLALLGGSAGLVIYGIRTYDSVNIIAFLIACVIPLSFLASIYNFTVENRRLREIESSYTSMPYRPPGPARYFVYLFSHNIKDLQLRQELTGDLLEGYGLVRDHFGKRKADVWYWRKALSFLSLSHLAVIVKILDLYVRTFLKTDISRKPSIESLPSAYYFGSEPMLGNLSPGILKASGRTADSTFLFYMRLLKRLVIDELSKTARLLWSFIIGGNRHR